MSDLAAVAVLLVVAVLGEVFARQLGGRYAVAAAMAWGLAVIVIASTIRQRSTAKREAAGA